MSITRFSGGGSGRSYGGRRRLEHWYRDNQVHLITARCRDRRACFAGEPAKVVFWDRFAHYTQAHGFTPWVTSLLDNHYHILGYLRRGDDLGPMMRKLHGSVAKLVNDQLDAAGQERHLPFWKQTANHDYFDGCLRDEKQGRASYRYVCIQGQRHGVVRGWREYPHTRVGVELERAITRALQLGAFLEGVPYRRCGEGKK